MILASLLSGCVPIEKHSDTEACAPRRSAGMIRMLEYGGTDPMPKGAIRSFAMRRMSVPRKSAFGTGSGLDTPLNMLPLEGE